MNCQVYVINMCPRHFKAENSLYIYIYYMFMGSFPALTSPEFSSCAVTVVCAMSSVHKKN